MSLSAMFIFRCVICMIEFQVGDQVRYLPCMHMYHIECIDDWLMRSFTCPSCMEPVDAALLGQYGIWSDWILDWNWNQNMAFKMDMGLDMMCEK